MCDDHTEICQFGNGLWFVGVKAKKVFCLTGVVNDQATLSALSKQLKVVPGNIWFIPTKRCEIRLVENQLLGAVSVEQMITRGFVQ